MGRKRLFANFTVGVVWHPDPQQRGRATTSDFYERVGEGLRGQVPLAGLELNWYRCVVLYDSGRLDEFRSGRHYRYITNLPAPRFWGATPILSLTSLPDIIAVWIKGKDDNGQWFLVDLKTRRWQVAMAEGVVVTQPSQPIREVSASWSLIQNLSSWRQVRLATEEFTGWKAAPAPLPAPPNLTPPRNQPIWELLRSQPIDPIKVHLKEYVRAAWSGLSVVPFIDPHQKKFAVATIIWRLAGSPTGEFEANQIIDLINETLGP